MTMKRKIKKQSLVILGSAFIIVGISLLVYKYQNLNKTNKEEINAINNYYINHSNYHVNTETVKKVSKEYNYIAVLKIPKINLERGLVDPNSSQNNVKYNIEILKNSDMPDVENGNFILAAHSGNSKVSYFKNLNKLELGDTVSIDYNGETYNYAVTKIYDIEKTGKAQIIRNKNKTTLTLVTCRAKTNNQIIVICEKL